MSLVFPSYEEQRRHTLMNGCTENLFHGDTTIENATFEDLNEALDQRARNNDRTAWKLIRAEIRRRMSEGGVQTKYPKTIDEHRAQFAADTNEIEREHQVFEQATPRAKAAMLKLGYRPREAPIAFSNQSPMSKSTTHALTVLAAKELTVGKDDINELQETAAAQIAAVGQMESTAAKGAILAGITLHRVKASLPHGKFGAWVASLSGANVHRGGNLRSGKSQANYYMRLAQVFIERTKLKKTDLLALPDGQSALDSGDTTKHFCSALESFVGELSLNELLIRHNIKAVRKYELEQRGDEEVPRKDPQMDFFADLAERIHGYREIVTSRETLKRLTPQQLDQLYQEQSDLHARFVKLYEEAKDTVQI